MKDSHEFAQELQRLATELIARPAFPVGYVLCTAVNVSTKEQMIAAVKALGSGKKSHDSYSFDFAPDLGKSLNFSVSVPKSQVCRKVQDEVWECDPLLAEADPLLAEADEAAA